MTPSQDDLIERFKGALAETDWELAAFVRENATAMLERLAASTRALAALEQR